MKKLISILIILLILVAGLYWWFLMRTPKPVDVSVTPTNDQTFNPINRPGSGGSTSNNNSSNIPTNSNISTEPISQNEGNLPRLRHLSSTPIGGYTASTTASSTLVRYIDRGIGHVFEATDISASIDKISNTTIPRVYESFWNKNASAAVIRYMKDNDGTIANFFAELRPVPTTPSSTPEMPFEIKGKFLDQNIQEVAVSPKGDKIFTFNVEDGKGVGYTSNFDENKKTKIFETPLTQVYIDWPEENTLVVGSRASGGSQGYFYSIDLKKPIFKRLVGNVMGLTAKMNPDGKKVLYSSAGSQGFTMSLYNLKDNSTQDIAFKTPTEKCVWSKLHPSELYCAVPSSVPQALYPDDWYKGKVSFNDQIWHLDTVTGEVTLMANLLNLSNDLIDAINLKLDPKENYIYFVNKRDLTLWSLNLSE